MRFIPSSLWMLCRSRSSRTVAWSTKRSLSLAFGVNIYGLKEVLGIWASDNEGAKFWMQIITELKNRGVQDIFIAGCPLGGSMD